MSVDSETLAILQKAALSGLPLESTSLELNDEVLATYERLKEEYANAPAGSMAYIVEDLEWGGHDSIIEATEKAYGPMFGDKTLAEMTAERLASVRKQRKTQGQGSELEAE